MKKKFKKIIFWVFITLGFSMSMNAQQISIETKAKEAIIAAGLTEDEVRVKLAEKGIDYDDLASLDIDQAMLMQKEIENAVIELQEEKLAKKSREPNIQKSKNTKTEDPKRTKNIQHEKMVSSETKVNNEIPKVDTTKLTVGKTDTQNVNTLWGQHIFSSGHLIQQPYANELKPPDSYILGIGDQVTVSIWGLSHLNESYVINEEGSINPTRMPRIFLKGLPISRARTVLKNYFARFYRFESNQFAISLNSARTININIFGEVQRYGGFTIPATHTAFNALQLAGGPTEIGSVRRIKLIRNGKEKIVDVYKYMQNPGDNKDYYLENNDVLQIPVAGKTIKITGAVVRPMRYELLDGEDLKKLIEYAGGLKENAIQRTIQIQRIEKDKRIFIDVPYQEIIGKGGDFVLKKGDEILVFELKSKPEEFVQVNGAVRSESNYQYYPGMKLSDLLKKVDLQPEANLENAFLKRKNSDESINLLRVNLGKILNGSKEDDIVLRPQDELTVYHLSTYKDKSYVHVIGAIRLPGKIELDPNGELKIRDLVLLSGGLKPEAFNYAFLFRLNKKANRDFTVIRLGIQDAMDNPNSDQNIIVKAYDSLIVLSETNFLESTFVEIIGSVRSPGQYTFGNGMTVHDLLSLANGFNFAAATNRIDVFRLLIKDNEETKTIVQSIQMDRNLEAISGQSNFKLEPYDILVVRNQPAFELQQIVNIEGEVRYPGPYALLSANEKIEDLIQRAGGFGAEAFPEGATLYRTQDNIGYVVLELTKAIVTPQSSFNLILKDLDYVFIPKQKDLVKIQGATNVLDLYPEKILSSNNSISVAFQEGKNARYYIDQYAAGLSKQGDPGKISVEHANGKISRTKRTLFSYKYPKVTKGATVNAGYKDIKEEKKKEEKKEVDWGKVVADSIAQATAVLSLILIIQNLK